ncbi:MAG: YdbL family protein [Maricaulaceae bacterium]|jgi:uncharacterized protein YdbL (DUF1318 family)
MKRLFAAFVISIFALASSQAPAWAAEALDGARASCEIGEQIDGYLGVVAGAAPSAQAIAEMQEINVRRRAVYARVARENGQPLDVVARLTGERQVVKAQDEGECYKDDGGWKQPAD